MVMQLNVTIAAPQCIFALLVYFIVPSIVWDKSKHNSLLSVYFFFFFVVCVHIDSIKLKWEAKLKQDDKKDISLSLSKQKIDQRFTFGCIFFH